MDTSDPVRKGDVIGRVMSVGTLKTTELKSPVSGYLYKLGCYRYRKPGAVPTGQHPYADKGDELAVIARNPGG